ncbi:cytochrome c oxidase assembly protein [Brachybacterium muris]|uniref:cytochrome c oxidase assembly protein n=1 Tax=Brachybacterium muris TaxID=219301 RepID=UPI0023BAA11D|nr:cytochrome c oxidase assembly protein [Brachybacterium muris]
MAHPLSNPGRFRLTHPVVLALFGAVSFAAIYLTPALRMGLETAPGRLVVLCTAVVGGVALALPVQGRALGGGTLSWVERSIAAMAGTLVLAGLALTLALSREVVQDDWFGAMGRDWGADALGDQRLGGLVLCAVLLVLAGVHSLAILRQRRRGTEDPSDPHEAAPRPSDAGANAG